MTFARFGITLTRNQSFDPPMTSLFLFRFRLGVGIIAALLAITSPAPAMAQTDEGLYMRLASALSPSANAPIELLNPGLLVDPMFSASDLDEQAEFVSFYNRMSIPSLVYSPVRADLPSLYSSVLTDAEWAVVPLISAQRQELARINQLLYKPGTESPTAGYATYLEKKKTYEDVKSRYEATPESARSADLVAEYQAASDDLDLAGHRAKYQPAEARFHLLNDTKSLQWRTDDLPKFQAAQITSAQGKTWPSTVPQPNLDQLSDNSWQSITISSDDSGNQNVAPLLSKTRQPIVWWSWTPPLSTDSPCAAHLSGTSFVIHFEYRFVNINREWFDPRVFESQAWRWKSAGSAISDGQYDGNVGTAPMFTSQIIVARNLSISGPLFQTCQSAVRHEVQLHHDIGFGPFKLAGNNIGTNKFYLPAFITRDSLLVPYVQIIGVETTLLPIAPNPNVDFQWPTQ